MNINIPKRHYYQPSELQYMIGQDIEYMLKKDDGTLRLSSFFVEGIIHDEWVYGMSSHTVTGIPHFVFYNAITNAPTYELIKHTNLFRLGTGT